MTSFIAAGGAGRSTSFIPAVPAAWSVTTIAFMGIVLGHVCLWWKSGAGHFVRLYLTYVVSSLSSLSGTKTASSLAGLGVLALRLTGWLEPGGSDQLSPAL